MYSYIGLFSRVAKHGVIKLSLLYGSMLRLFSVDRLVSLTLLRALDYVHSRTFTENWASIANYMHHCGYKISEYSMNISSTIVIGSISIDKILFSYLSHC